MENVGRIEDSLVREPGTLENAVATLLGRFTKLMHAAEYCRVGPKNLSAYANPYQTGRHMPVDVVRDLERVARDPVVTRCLAAHQRQVLFRIPETFGHGFWDRHFREIVRESAEVFVMYSEALERERVSRNEAATLMVEVDRALAAFAALRNSLEQRAQRIPAARRPAVPEKVKA